MPFINKHAGKILLLASLIITVFTYRNYGVSWDEWSQMQIGSVSYNYLFHGDNALKTFCVADYGVAFELPLLIIQKILGITDSRDIYFFRHLLTNFLFLFSAYIFFLLIDFLYHSKILASLGFCFLVINPLIYGHSFFNAKDVPFLSLFILSFYAAAIAFKKYEYRYFIALGAVCALVTNIRIMGLLMILCVGILFLLDFITSFDDKQKRKKTIQSFLVFSFSTMAVLYATWPYLYEHPIRNLYIAFMDLKRFGWWGKFLFMGKVVDGHNIPYNYAITWFFISNSLPYLFFGFAGMTLFIIQLIKRPLSFIRNTLERNNLIYFACFTGPLASIFIFHSVLYDAWRHLYFIYPAFILLAIYFLDKIFQTKAKSASIILAFIGIVSTGYHIVKYFPFGHVYFNELMRFDEPEHLRKTYELEYWATSYMQGMEYILAHDQRMRIVVTGSPDMPCLYNLGILKKEDRGRLIYTDKENEADYLITNYRLHPQDFLYAPIQNIYTIKVLDNSILSVFKLK